MKIEEILQDKFNEKLEERHTSSYSNQVVLLTGAAGSIGRKLAILLLQTSLDILILADNSEANLYDLEQILLLKEFKKFKIELLDVSSRSNVCEIFQKYKPDIVYHAAAYKQVPLLEKFPHQAFKVNTIGTKNMIDSAVEVNTESFVLISTDKAVFPKSIMGVSKRMAEIYVSQFIEDINIKVVRFGNIPNTSGSVLPVWKKQLKLSSKIKVVDTQAERYFISLNDVCKVLLEITSIKKNTLFVTDMGNSININQLAISFLEQNNIGENDINYIGTRPGEKEKEQLYYGNENIIIKSDKLFWSGELTHDVSILLQLNKLIEKYNELNKIQLKDSFREIIPEYIN